MNYKSCNICPHKCKIDRSKTPSGFCKSSDKAIISSICIHNGEEPVISGKKGICNVFFAHCNMQCIYCQNYEISRNTNLNFKDYSVEDLADRIIKTLENTEQIVGFVSPSHFVPFICEIIDYIRNKGTNPIFVYNSNGFDSVESLKELDGKIDVYLPDFKYSNDDLAYKLSGIKNYPEIALMAIKEMYRQKGSSLFINNESGIAESGLIIRHLLLPGFLENSKNVLNLIANEISTSLNISLMSQYFPPLKIEKEESLNRKITKQEYLELIETFQKLGFYKGWIQDIESNKTYCPKIENNIISF